MARHYLQRKFVGARWRQIVITVVTTMHIREANPSDLVAIADLHTQSWRTTYRGVLSDTYLDNALLAERKALWFERFTHPTPAQYIAVAEIDHTLVGLACAYGDHDARWGSLLENLHVARRYKGAGLGTKLVRHIAQWCARTQSTPGLHLWVLAPNTAAQGFYRRLGANPVEESVWDAPDGSRVAELRFVWPHLNTLTP